MASTATTGSMGGEDDRGASLLEGETLTDNEAVTDEAPPDDLTELHAAALLGMAPEPAEAPDRMVTDPVAQLQPPSKPPEALRPVARAAYRIVSGLRKPPADVQASDIRDMSDTAERIAKYVSMAVVGLVLALTTMIGFYLFTGTGTPDEVTLSFVPFGPDAKASDLLPVVGDPPVPIRVESEPDDVRVRFRGRVIGKTPMSSELPVRLSGKVGVRLSGDHFESWVGEGQLQPSGTYLIRANLVRKRR